mgnify:FL=1
MASKVGIDKYKFVSPGVFVEEIDNSFLPSLPGAIGPVIIGRAPRGPAMRPVQVSSFSQFIETFGNPAPSGVSEKDVSRYGNNAAPTYAMFAAQAYLKNGEVATFVRLLGTEHSDKEGGGEAGWEEGPLSNIGSGAYGLFLINSGTAPVNQTGALAAIWYFKEGVIMLTGTVRGASGVDSLTSTLFNSQAKSKEFTAIIKGKKADLNAVQKEITFNFDPDSDKFIRKVFNTNPILTNNSLTDSAERETYWLGPTYERFVEDKVGNTGASANVFGMILGITQDSGSTDGGEFRKPFVNANSGWIISQDVQSTTGGFDALSTDRVQKLFRFHSLDGGDWINRNIKISIKDIAQSTNAFDPYGTFTVIVRDAQDTDNAPSVLEQYMMCDLNPHSPNYIARLIGDKTLSFDDTERRLKEYGSHGNVSKFIRVQMNDAVDEKQTVPELLPYGFWGPLRPQGFTVFSGSAGEVSRNVTAQNTVLTTAPFANSWVTGGAGSVVSGNHGLGYTIVRTGTDVTADNGFTGSFIFPTVALRTSSIDGTLPRAKDAYFGYDSTKKHANVFDPSNIDILKMWTNNSSDGTETSFAFTLDELVLTGSGQFFGKNALYTSGSRASGSSASALSGTSSPLDQGFNRFTVPMFGGFDGLDVREQDPFAERNITGNETTNYEFNSIKRAVDTVADPEYVDMNLMAMPGITDSTLNDHMVDVCERRGDALAIVDLPNIYIPRHEGTNYGTFSNRIGTITGSITNLNSRRLNSSYACTYYPWVQIRDTINGTILWAPPSVVALGTFASTERGSELWFAPAGFNRGGLSEGAAGIPVVGVTERLTSKNRDTLYNANINPIASFPNEGIVIFGQKTLQVTPSALDRINVRRLLIYVKREISRMARTVLFEQNVKVTWNKFIGIAEPFLRSVQVRLGLSDFKLVLDETTTTPDLIDRNIMYAQVYLKPARSIEFIAVDFVITDSGASFAD